MKPHGFCLKAVAVLLLVAMLVFMESCEEAGTDDGTAVTVEISGIVLSEGTLTPVFDPATTAYSATVPNATSSVTVTVTTELTDLEISINGDTVIPGDGVKEIALDVGENAVEIVVSDGTDSVTYSVTVTRLAATPTIELSGLSLSEGTLDPAFDPGVTAYTASVPNETSSVVVSVTTASEDHEVTIDSVAVIPGAGSKEVDLSVGENPVEIVVTDGTDSETYTVTITRLPVAPPVELSGLSLSEGTLDPAFDSATTSYTATVPNATSAITVTVTAASGDLQVTIDSTTVLPGSGSTDVDLAVGDNSVPIVVTDGIDSETYTVTVTRLSPAEIQVVGKLNYSDLTESNIPSGSTIDFESVYYEDTRQMPFTINNIGETTLNLLAEAPDYVVLTSNPDSVYTIITQPLEATIPAGDSREFVVEFEETGFSTGPMTGTLEISNDDSDEGIFTLDLTGESVSY